MISTRSAWRERISAIASLDDEMRRRLFAYLRQAQDAVGRDEAARAMGIPRSTASFHLDRLVRAGLAVVEFRKQADKGGPGSGRPAKFYRPALNEVVASVPERQYDVAGDLLAAVVARSLPGRVPVGEALLEVAEARGREFGRPGDVAGALADVGYEPAPQEDGGYRLLNCPFHQLSQDHPDVVCAMNAAFLKGTATASGLAADSVRPDPGPGHCCARIDAPGHRPEEAHDSAVPDHRDR
ncbi:helix-turn-helix domain-containing protein [Arthrobacter sp. efr-133-TYG-104]|uniref:helix-turn-helix transcriptional regulator n=1 Tax=Arthrobacter sp. efr-133-TYG-104 TaxID=3040324 RepID=UPI00254C035F|nr:helix-turn-helix domain-containing protein [Arthrobacter sp. efr-133-TYG-104]